LDMEPVRLRLTGWAATFIAACALLLVNNPGCSLTA
jgi:hypothetical protein